jgi:hypothetical protein
MPSTSVSRSGGALDHAQGVHLEVRDHPPGQLAADAGDDARAEEALDAGQGLGRARGVAGQLELAAELLVVDPLAAHGQRHARRQLGQLADDRGLGAVGLDQAGHRPQGLGVAVDDATQLAGQGRGRRLRPGEQPGLVAAAGRAIAGHAALYIGRAR